MGKNLWQTLTAVVLIIAVVCGVLFYFFFNSAMNSLPPEPDEYVKNASIQDNRDFLYKEKIIRYPVKGVVIPFFFNESLRIGVSVDKNLLDFGIISSSLSVNKALEFKNDDTNPAKVNIVAYGNIKPYITIKENNFILKPGEFKRIGINMNASEVGEYSGEVDVILRIPAYGPLVYLMK